MKLKAKTVTIRIPKNKTLQDMFNVAAQITGSQSLSEFFFNAAADKALELLEENAKRVKEAQDKAQTQLKPEKTPEQVAETEKMFDGRGLLECNHINTTKMTSGSGEVFTHCADCNVQLSKEDKV